MNLNDIMKKMEERLQELKKVILPNNNQLLYAGACSSGCAASCSGCRGCGVGCSSVSPCSRR